MVTESAAEAVLDAAREWITTPANRPLVVSIPQYYLEVAEENWETARDAINRYLASARTGETGDRQVCENTAAYPNADTEDYGDFYVYMIAAITLAAVLCVSVMLPAESLRFTILRSIGMTKPQLALLIAEEMLILSAPAVFTGLPCGAGLTWLSLAAAFGTVTIFTAIESMRPNYLREYWALCPSYTVWRNNLVSEAELNLIRQIPGISGADRFGEMEIQLSYPGLEERTTWIYAFWEPYTIFCSEAFLQQILDSMQPGQQWDKYISGEPFGYDRAYVAADLNSDSYPRM